MRRTASRVFPLASRLLGHPFTLVSAVSLIACIGVCVLWGRSYRLSDQFMWRGEEGWRSVRTAQGSIVMGRLRSDWSGRPPDFYGLRYERAKVYRPFNTLTLLPPDPTDVDSGWERGGFAWYEKRKAGSRVLHATGVAPFWSIVAVTAALPLGWTALRLRARIRGRRRRGGGHCVGCGYDLRASPERCPECGAVNSPSTTLRT